MALSPSSKYLQRAHDPVDDLERDSLTDRLNVAFGEGRITHDEYAAALDAVYAARTLGDLVPVVEQLPAPAAPVPAIVAQSNLPAGQLGQSRNVAKATYAAIAAGGALLVAIVVLLVLVL